MVGFQEPQLPLCIVFGRVNKVVSDLRVDGIPKVCTGGPYAQKVSICMR